MRIELTRYPTLFRVSWVVWLAGVVWRSRVSGTEMASLESAVPLLPSRHAILAALAAGLTLFAPTAVHSQALNACDLNGDGAVDIRDAQMAANMALGLAPCTANVIGIGVCDISVIQRVIDAALSGLCRTGDLHSVTLNWTASTSSNVTGYNVYRGTHSNGPYTKLNSALVAGTTYTDLTVLAGQTYYYVTTAVDADSNESAYSNEAPAVIPYP